MKIYYCEEKRLFSLYGGEGFKVYCTFSYKTKRIKVIELVQGTKQLVENIYEKFDLIAHLNDPQNNNALVKLVGIED